MKPKYKITKAQLRKRRNRRLVTKPVRQEVKRALSQLVAAYAQRGETHGTTITD